MNSPNAPLIRLHHCGVAAAALAWLALCFWLRALFVAADAPQLCGDRAESMSCALRAVVGASIYRQNIGHIALLLALLAWVPQPRARRAIATTALAVSTLALVFYNASYGSLAAVLAVLALASPLPRR